MFRYFQDFRLYEGDSECSRVAQNISASIKPLGREAKPPAEYCWHSPRLSRSIQKTSSLLLNTAWPVLKAATANVNLVCAAVCKLDDVGQADARLFHLALGSTRHTRREPSVGQQGTVDLPHALLLSQPLEVVVASVMNLQLSNAPPFILYTRSAAKLPGLSNI